MVDTGMAIFVDQHLAEGVTLEVFGRMIQEAEQPHADADGVRVLGHRIGGQHVYCVLQAPDADAVRQHHTTRGLPCDEIRQVEGLDGMRSGGRRDQLVCEAVATFWPSATT
jgi:Protein of unknown function (DUF4242)